MHYEYLGTVERFIEGISVVGIRIADASLRRGERIAFELPVVFEEQRCDSLEFENEEIDSAEKGMLIGLKTHLVKEQAREEGTRVFKLQKAEAGSPEQPSE